MIVRTEYEDERGILQRLPQQHDSVLRKIIEILSFGQIPGVEGIYLTRGMEGYSYDGTVFANKEIYHIKVLDGKIYYLPESKRYGFRKGRPINECSHSQVIYI